MAAQGGLYAPSIRYHKGTFYIVCTNVLHKSELPYLENEFQNFILSTTDIWANEWSDPVFYDFFGIDTSLFWDDDDRVYLIGSASPAPETKIRQFEIDLKTGKKLSEEKLLWEGITKVFPEGPHMYKKDGWYYLLIAEGGCFEDHHTIMARSKSIWGPFEVNPENPVMKKTTSEDYIQFTGHGDLFQDESGQWYFICLGARKTKEGRFIMGRETFLTTAQWPEGAYPTINKTQLEAPIAKGRPALPQSPVDTSRLSVTPSLDLLHIRDPDPSRYQYQSDRIVLKASRAQLDQAEAPVTFVGKRQRLLEGEASATLISVDALSGQNGNLDAGVCYYKDEHRFSRIMLSWSTKTITWEIVNKAKSIASTASRDIADILSRSPLPEIHFGISYTETRIRFWYSLKSGQYSNERVELGNIDTLEMTGYDFVGPVIGIFATGDSEASVNFEGFGVE